MKSINVFVLMVSFITCANAQDRLAFSISASGGYEQFAPYTNMANVDPIVSYGNSIISFDSTYSFEQFTVKCGIDMINTNSYEENSEISLYARDLNFGGHIQLEYKVGDMFVPFIGLSLNESIDLEYKAIIGKAIDSKHNIYDVVHNFTGKATPDIGVYLGAYVYKDGPFCIFVRVMTREWEIDFSDHFDKCNSLGFYLGTEYRF